MATSASMPPQDLVTALQSGSYAAFDYFFHLHFRPLSFFASRLLQRPSDVQDIVQEAFIKLWERREQFQSPGHIKGYLYKKVYYTCLDARQRYLRDSPLCHTEEATEEPILHSLIRTETWNRVYSQINGLSPAVAKVMHLLYVEGKSVAETAKELHKSIPTIKSQKARGLEALKGKLPDALLILLWLYHNKGE